MMRFFRISMQILALFAMLLLGACNLSPEEVVLPTATPTAPADSKPTVTIESPSSGSQHRVNNELAVTVNVKDAIGVTRITMSANNQPVKTVSAASGETILDKRVQLDYVPLVSGNVTLQVVAYRNQVASEPAQVTVIISNIQPTPTTGVIVTQGPVIDPNDPTCRALINNPLNFRSGPGTNYSAISTLAQGSVIPVVGRLGNNSWYQLNYGQLGWVSSQFVSLYGTFCVNVPIIAAPATPTPNVTNTFIPPTAPPTFTPTATPGTPDLVITVFDGSGSGSDRYPDALLIPTGQTEVTGQYEIIVANTGSGPTGSFAVSLRVRPGGEIVKVAVGNLRAGESTNILRDYRFAATGSFTLEAMVDADSTVAELSEANNKASIIVDVMPE